MNHPFAILLNKYLALREQTLAPSARVSFERNRPAIRGLWVAQFVRTLASM